MAAPVYSDVEAASRRMQGKIHVTPVLESLALNNLAGCRVLVKAEALQVPHLPAFFLLCVRKYILPRNSRFDCPKAPLSLH